MVFILLERRRYGVENRTNKRNRGNLTFPPKFYFSKQTDKSKKDVKQKKSWHNGLLPLYFTVFMLFKNALTVK